MQQRVRRKWRPPLALVIGGTLAAVLLLPLVAIVPLRLFGNIMGWREIAFMVGWIAVLSTSVLGYLLWRLVLRPTYRLTSYAQSVEAGATGLKPPTQLGTPEFTELADSVVGMGATLHNRAEGLRAYTDHVTHELKSPLTSMNGALELLNGDLPDADRARLLTTAKQSAERMNQLLNDLRDHARARDVDPRGQSQLGEVVQGLRSDIKVVVAHDGDVPLSKAALGAILTQLIQNAQGHGASEVVLTCDAASLSIADNGRGVAEGDAARIFDPFFTTTRETGGTGMGLSITQSLLETVGARISLVPNGQGAHFRINFRQ